MKYYEQILFDGRICLLLCLPVFFAKSRTYLNDYSLVVCYSIYSCSSYQQLLAAWLLGIYADVTLVKNTVKMQSILFSAVSMLFVVSFSAMWKSTKILFYFMFYHHHIITIFHLLRFASSLCRCYIFHDDFYV